MPLTPLDIHNKEFSRGFRGYDEDEVNEFLDQIISGMDKDIWESWGAPSKIKSIIRKNEWLRISIMFIRQVINNIIVILKYVISNQFRTVLNSNEFQYGRNRSKIRVIVNLP